MSLSTEYSLCPDTQRPVTTKDYVKRLLELKKKKKIKSEFCLFLLSD